MSRPKKSASSDNNTPPVKREKRIDPLPAKVYYKHFAANLSLGCVRTAETVLSVFLHDSATFTYSDVTELAELTAVAKKVFRGKDAQPHLIAAFKDAAEAKEYMDTWLENLTNQETLENEIAEETPEPINA